MDVYLKSIRTAVILFPLLAIILTIPYLIYNYRKYGSVSYIRSFILFTFYFYLLCAFFLVILPLPDKQPIIQNRSAFIQLIPFNFIIDFFKETVLNIREPLTYISALKQNVFLQPIFNIVLTIPFGMYIAYYFDLHLKKTMMFTFFLSLFFEITQITAIYGLYSQPYRLFDIDDLFLNTLGGIFGYGLMYYIKRIVPSKHSLDQKSFKRSVKVSYTRRILAYIIDWAIISILSFIINQLLSWDKDYIFNIIFFLYFIGSTVITDGRTIGKSLVRLHIICKNTNQSRFLSFCLRYFLLWLWIHNTDLLLIIPLNNSPVLFLILFLFIYTLIVWDLIYSTMHDKELFYERISKTKNKSVLVINK